MKIQNFLIALTGFISTVPALALSTGNRSVFLNGIDISSAKNQSMQQVNIKIDSQGNVYIEAPQYEAQQESTFVPLGPRRALPGMIPQHRAPGPLPNRLEQPAQAELAPLEETRVEQGAVKDKNQGDPDGSMLKKEGARVPTDGSTKQSGAEASSTTDTNSATRQ
jgi:hypothetical protein